MGIIEFIKDKLLIKDAKKSKNQEKDCAEVPKSPKWVESVSEDLESQDKKGTLSQEESIPDVMITKSDTYCSPDFFRFMMECNIEATKKDGLSTAEREIPFSVSDCDSMDGHEFEGFCAQLFADCGYSDVTVTRGSGDQGIDILAKKRWRIIRGTVQEIFK